MDRENIMGALRFPMFLMVWSAGVVLFATSFYPADASLVRATHFDLPAVPEFADIVDLSPSLESALRDSDVVSGRWQPSQEESRPPPLARPSVRILNDSQADQVATGEHDEAAENGVDAPNGRAAQDRGEHITKLPVAAAPIDTAQGARKPKESTSLTEKQHEPGASALRTAKQAARSALERRDSAQAYEILMGDIALGRFDTEYLGLLAVAAIHQGLAAEAQVVYERLTLMQPDNHRWWAGLAVARQSQGLDSQHAIEQVLALADEGSDLRRFVLASIESTG